MSRRYLVFGLAVVLALALAVPAFGGPTNPLSNLAASSKNVAAKALKTAKAAKKSAASAQTSANEAGTAAMGAQTTANEAKKKAETAQTAATGAQTTANTALSTANSAKTTAGEALASANSSLKATEFESSKPDPETGTDTTTSKLVAVECKAGQVVTGGGYSLGGSETNKVTVTSEGSAFYGPGWLVDAQAIAGQTPSWSLTTVAVCAHP